MEKIEVVEKVLSRVGCQTARQISCLAKQWFDEDITPASISGTLRGLVAKGKAASSNSGNGKTVYWLVKEQW